MSRQLRTVESFVVAQRVIDQRDEAEEKALDALARYKFQMFGYWAAIWVHLNRAIGDNKPNPFAFLVKAAREAA